VPKIKHQPQNLSDSRSAHTSGSVLSFLLLLNPIPGSWHSTPKASLLSSPCSLHVHQLYGFSTNYTCGAELDGALVCICSLITSQPTANPFKQQALFFRHTRLLQVYRQEARTSYFDTSVRTRGRYTRPSCSKIWRPHTIMSREVRWHTFTYVHTILTRYGCENLVQLEASSYRCGRSLDYPDSVLGCKHPGLSKADADLANIVDVVNDGEYKKAQSPGTVGVKALWKDGTL